MPLPIIRPISFIAERSEATNLDDGGSILT